MIIPWRRISVKELPVNTRKNQTNASVENVKCRLCGATGILLLWPWRRNQWSVSYSLVVFRQLLVSIEIRRLHASLARYDLDRFHASLDKQQVGRWNWLDMIQHALMRRGTPHSDLWRRNQWSMMSHFKPIAMVFLGSGTVYGRFQSLDWNRSETDRFKIGLLKTSGAWIIPGICSVVLHVFQWKISHQWFQFRNGRKLSGLIQNSAFV